jgi:hypothetical protein
MNRQTRGLSAATLILALAACGTSKDTPKASQATAAQPGSTAAAGATDAREVFAAVMDAMKKDVQFPVRVPTRLPDMGQGSQRIFAWVERARSQSYSIILGTEAGCTGGNYCRLGTIAAEKIAGDSRPPTGGKNVTLQDGVAGYYFFNECGANCPDNTVVWEQGGVRYTVGIKSGREEQLIQLANATIAGR